MSKRKAPEEDVWFVLQEDGVLHTVAKSRKEALSTDETTPTFEYVQIKKSEEGETSCINASDNESGIVYEEADDNFNDLNDGTGALILPRELRLNTGCKWPTEAVWRLLDLIEAKSGSILSLPASKKDDEWTEIADGMKPFEYTKENCQSKFKRMKLTYLKLARRKALDMFPVHWKFFSKMSEIMGDLMPDEDSTGDEDDETEEAPASNNQTGLLGTMSEAERLNRFDQLLDHKKDVLDEVRRQGDLLKQFVQEVKESDSRREKREVEMIELMKSLRDQEEQKTALFNKLLDKL